MVDSKSTFIEKHDYVLEGNQWIAHAILYSRALHSAKSLQSPQHREVNVKILLKHVRKNMGHF